MDMQNDQNQISKPEEMIPPIPSSEQMMPPVMDQTNSVTDSTSTSYASFFTRLLAYIIDSVVLALAQMAIILPLSSGGEPNPIAYFFTIGLSLFYFIYLTNKYGATFGKMALKIKVVREDSQMLEMRDVLFREVLGRMLSNFIFISYIWPLFDEKNQTWHDKIAKTVVVKNS